MIITPYIALAVWALVAAVLFLLSGYAIGKNWIRWEDRDVAMIFAGLWPTLLFIIPAIGFFWLLIKLHMKMRDIGSRHR